MNFGTSVGGCQQQQKGGAVERARARQRAAFSCAQSSALKQEPARERAEQTMLMWRPQGIERMVSSRAMQTRRDAPCSTPHASRCSIRAPAVAPRVLRGRWTALAPSECAPRSRRRSSPTPRQLCCGAGRLRAVFAETFFWALVYFWLARNGFASPSLAHRSPAPMRAGSLGNFWVHTATGSGGPRHMYGPV